MVDHLTIDQAAEELDFLSGVGDPREPILRHLLAALQREEQLRQDKELAIATVNAFLQRAEEAEQREDGLREALRRIANGEEDPMNIAHIAINHQNPNDYSSTHEGEAP